MSRTRVSQATIFLGDKADDIVLDFRDCHTTLVLGTAAAINLDDCDQATLDRLATAAARAAANHRARTLREVA